MKIRKRKIKRGLKRVLSVLLAVAFILNLPPFSELSVFWGKGIEQTVHAAYIENKDRVPEDKIFYEEQARVRSYYNAETESFLLDNTSKILDYSRAYFSYPDDHENDRININFGQGASVSAINEFIAIGTEEHPFRGVIKLTTTSNNALSIPEAFFDYISDSATIISDSTGLPTPLILTRTLDETGEPVFARHVIHDNDGEPVSWQVQLNRYAPSEQNTNNYNVGGFIGEMEEGAKIILDIVDNTTCNTYGINDIGYVCGKMGKNSTLTVNSISSNQKVEEEIVTVSPINVSYSISTTSGNAGGVIGSMEDGARLILNCGVTNSSATIRAAGDGNYAGGIVGYNDGGSVEIGIDGNSVAVFSSSNKYLIQNTLVGVAGAGGIFGYYKPIFTANETTGDLESVFDISWLQIGTGTGDNQKMIANGTGSVGGLFGVLENEIATVTPGEGDAPATTAYSSGKIIITDYSDNSAVIYLDHADSNVVTNYGGLIGKYTACTLSGSLEVTNVTVNVARSNGNYENYGGAIGITEGGNSNDTKDALYVKFDDFNVTVASGNDSSTSVYGGLVARSSNAFIDAKDIAANSANNFYGGGVIGRMDNGVLRLSGTTDLTGGYARSSADNYYYEGQIVGGRDSSIVFAESEWVLKRSNACSVDDIGSWGEVLRFTGIDTDTAGITKEQYGSNTVLTVNEDNHTVTIAAPSTQTTISSIADYAMLSLRFQIKETAGLSVAFDDSWNYTELTIIEQPITLDATFSLAGTGLIGLTRDNAKINSTAYCVYKGKFDGGNHTLTLATGEAYGMRGNSSLSDHAAQGNGKIYRHIYTGLFGIIDGDYDATTNYAVKELTLDGTIDVSAEVGTFYCGGFAARAIQDLTASKVKTKVWTDGSETTTGFRMTHAGSKELYMGRFVGECGTGIELISIANCEFGGSITGSNDEDASCFGGVIGKISHNTDATRTWNFNSVTLKGLVENTTANFDTNKKAKRIGGFIAEIDGDYNNNNAHRTLTLADVTVEGLKVCGDGALASNGTMGGLLGYSWLKTDVVMTDVTVKNSATVDIGTASAKTAGIVYCATGHWTVTKLDIQSLKMTATNASSIGAIVNKGVFYSESGKTFYNAANRSAIYLELPSGYTYNLTFSDESINTSAVFDELCAYTCPGDADILKNGNGIISINTINSSDNNSFVTDGENASNSYHAQTTYGAKPNSNARYYYNLDTVTKTDAAYDALSAAQKTALAPQVQLMSWGLDCYACKNLKQYFADPFGGTMADLNYSMSGYSWYPINLDSDMEVKGTFTFFNQEFEDSENEKYATESVVDDTKAYKRTSLYDSSNSSTTQHYLMHNGLFHDINSCTLTIGHLALSGDVAGYASSGNTAVLCGALVCGTVSGTSSSKVATIKMSTANDAGISLEGIRVYNVGAAHDNALLVSAYAPLLINKLDSHAALNLSNISTSNAYNSSTTSMVAATSLIGDVGNSSATDVNLEFKLMKLDGRNATGASDADLSNAAKGNFNSMYNTYNSIFSKATLLNSFSYGSGSSGRYDFTWEQDWDTDGTEGADAVHNGNVTYGKELGYDSEKYPKTGTLSAPYYNTQYPDEEFKYSRDGARYSNPITSSDSDHEYWGNTEETNLFVKNFLPYVAEKYNANGKKYQLQVNHAAVTVTGCGTYNHPYVINKGDDIEDFCYWINNNAAGATLRIPTEGLVYDALNPSVITAITGTWCTDHTSDILCSYNTELGFVFPDYTEISVGEGVNPSTAGLYEYVYTLSGDTEVNNEKTYYAQEGNAYTIVTPEGTENPHASDWYERGTTPELSSDTAVLIGKKYYALYRFNQDVLRTYLAGAYYKIADNAAANDLYIDDVDRFTGFGASDTNAYRFRGVFDGNQKTIVNKTTAPFIYYSNGCVVKNITIDVQPASDIQLVGYQATFDEMWSSKNLKAKPAETATGNAAYGGVIARVMGGDTILDNVSVKYSSMNQKFTLPAKYAQYVPLGGYIGVIVNGGVIFRNMGTAASAYTEAGLKDSLINGIPKTAYKPSGASSNFIDAASSYTATTKYLDNKAWLYINPYIGRVINGFAVNETSEYHPYETGSRALGSGNPDSGTAVVMQNGTKHYSITDINSSIKNGVKEDQIVINNNSVTISSGQDWFLMSLMINSGMDQKALGYNQLYQVSRRASYSSVGTEEGTSTACSDYDTYAQNDVLVAETHISTEYGYLAQAYNSTGAGGKFASNDNLALTLSSDIILPDGYKGIGNLFNNSNDYRIRIKTLSGGEDGHAISQNTSYYYYNDDIAAYTPSTGFAGGLGLINYLNTASTYINLKLKGNVKTDLISTKDGTSITSKTPNDLTNNKYLCSGMLIGTTTAGPTIQNMALTNIDVLGLRNTGGLIGYQSGGTLVYSVAADTDYDSDKIIVHGRASTGGLIGMLNPGYAKVDMGGNTFNLTKVVCDNTNDRGGSYYNFGVGGFVGMLRAGWSKAANNAYIADANHFKNIVIGTENQAQIVECKGTEIFTAGVVGIMNKCNGITIDNCKFYNLSVDAKFAAAGLVAFPTTYTPAVVTNTHLYSPLGSVISSSTDFAGGLIGSSDPRIDEKDGSRDFTFDNCSISGYTIAGKKAAGGVIGYRGSAGDLPLYIKNTKVSDCTIKSDGNLGGLIGEMINPVAGYNILAADLSFDTFTELEENEIVPDSYKAGYICGSINTKSENCTYDTTSTNMSLRTEIRTGTTPSIKIAGFSRQMEDPTNMLATLVGTNNAGGNYGQDGYVVFADYNDKATTDENAEYSNVIINDSDIGELVATKTTVAENTYTVVTNETGIVKINPDPFVSDPDPNKPDIIPAMYADELDVDNPIKVVGGEGKKIELVPNSVTLDGIIPVNLPSDLSTLLPDTISTNGFYIYYLDSKNSGGAKRFLTKQQMNHSGGTMLKQAENITDSDLAIWFFEYDSEKNTYKIYTKIGTEKNYIYNNNGNGVALTNDRNNEKTNHIISRWKDGVTYKNTYHSADKEALFIINAKDTTRIFERSGGGGNFRYYNGWFGSTADECYGQLYLYPIPDANSVKTTNYSNGLTTTGTSVEIAGTTSSITYDNEDEIAVYNAAINGLPAENGPYTVYVITQTTYKNIFDLESNKAPYVTTNPKKYISVSQWLTSDAIGFEGTQINYANSTIKDILSDASNKKYEKTGITLAAKFDLISKLDTYGKYGSYLKQMGASASSSYDFPVLVIDDVTTTTNTLINNYLCYLTNTDYDFAAGNSDVFNVQLGACVWNGSSFTYYAGEYRSSSEANSNPNGSYLYIRNRKFTIDNGLGTILYDNETGNRFTLIDVQFYDPSDTSESRKIAYHLYVPVVVKKMLYYDFHASFLSGTNYRVAPYEVDSLTNKSKRGNTLIDNTGNPITLEVQWTYDRNLEGWQAALEAGEDFYHTALEKRLKVQNHRNGIPDGAKMVLVDANNMNRFYYAREGDSGLFTQDGSLYKFDFSAFAGYTDSTLNDYFNVTATSATDDTVVRFTTTTEADAIIYDGSNYYKPAENGEFAITLTYKDTITTVDNSSTGKDGKIQDNYYITFYTDASVATKDLYHLEFFDYGSFENSTYPTLASDNDYPHMLIGDIFVNENFTISDLNSRTKMSLTSGADYNDTIKATYSVDVGINEAIKNVIKTYFLSDSVEVYQSFLIMLNKQDLSSSLQGIATRPDLISVSDFVIKNGNQTVATIDTNWTTEGGMSNPNNLTTANYIELRGNKNLRSLMSTACNNANQKYTISVSWELTYTDATKMAAQFPTRDSSNQEESRIGTLIGGSSNISSTPESAVYSKNVARLATDNGWKSNYPYYCMINTNAILTLNSNDVNNLNGEFYQLGINANDFDDGTVNVIGENENARTVYGPIKLNAVYDVSDLSAADGVESMKLSFTVSKKSNYGTALPFSDYIDGLTLYACEEGGGESEPTYVPLAGNKVTVDTVTLDNTTGATKIVYIVEDPDEVFNYDSETMMYQIPITLNAIVGSDFGDSKEYSNYMVRLEIDMYSDRNATVHIEGSNDDDHVIYTHAKILTNVIE